MTRKEVMFMRRADLSRGAVVVLWLAPAALALASFLAFQAGQTTPGLLFAAAASGSLAVVLGATGRATPVRLWLCGVIACGACGPVLWDAIGPTTGVLTYAAAALCAYGVVAAVQTPRQTG